MKSIYTDNAPKPAGHYSQAIEHGGLLYVSGQLPIIPQKGPIDSRNIGDQAQCALQNLKAILEAAGSSMSQVIKVTVYISDIQHWDTVNRVYAEAFGAHKPARAVVPTNKLHFDFDIEIEAIAAV